MPMEYKSLSAEAQARIKSNVLGVVPEPDYDAFLASWEAEHYSHSVLLEKATAEGNKEAAEAAKAAMATLESSVTNVRAGKRPDGTERRTPPAPPVSPSPAPVTPAPAPRATR